MKRIFPSDLVLGKNKIFCGVKQSGYGGYTEYYLRNPGSAALFRVPVEFGA